MKKYLIAIIVAIAAVFSFQNVAVAGGSVGIEYDHLTLNHTSNVNQLSVIPSISALGFTFDAKLSGVRNTVGATGTDVELRAAKSFTLAPNLDAAIRGGVGKAYSNGANVSYFSVEPIVSLKLNKPLSVNASYKYTRAFDATNRIKSNAIYIGADYALTKVDTVGVKLYKSNGDIAGKGFVVGYTRSF